MDSDSKLFQESVARLPDIKKLSIDIKKDISEMCTEMIAAAIPLVSAISPLRNVYGHYKERQFTKRAVIFLSTLSQSDTSQNDINDFIDELSKYTHESGYDTIVGMIDRLDNENKANILSNLLRFCAEKRYSQSDFLRVANALERVPFSDLNNISNYRNDFYEPGESEILASSGLIIQTALDAGHWHNGDEDGGFKYGLSRLGEIMLQFGFVNREYQYQGNGWKIGIKSVDETEIEDMFSEIHGSEKRP